MNVSGNYSLVPSYNQIQNLPSNFDSTDTLEEDNRELIKKEAASEQFQHRYYVDPVEASYVYNSRKDIVSIRDHTGQLIDIYV